VVIIADNILQVVLGCFTHEHIYPESSSSWREASGWRAAAVLLTGSGVAWLNMSSLLGSLIFRFALPQQAVLVLIMMLASNNMCARSFSLQKAHMFFHGHFTRAAAAVAPASLRPLLLPGALIPAEDAAYALGVCDGYQPLVLILFGFLLPTFYLYWREVKSRQHFLELQAAQGVLSRAAIMSPPTAWDYLVFAVPAVACIYTYARAVI
jgi:hypothetical protein